MNEQEDWAAPGAHQVSPGVYRIPLPLPNDGLRAVNVYAIADGDHVVMVDGGWALAESEELLEQSLDKIGYELEDISQFLVTHAHRDHYTQAAAVRRRFGACVGLGEYERASIESIGGVGSIPEPPQYKMLTTAGADHLARLLRRAPQELPNPADWDAPDEWLTAGSSIAIGTRTLDVVHTPGHTQGHVVFHDASAEVLFSGDHVLPHITPSIGFEQVPVTSPLADYLTSLRLVRTMPDAVLLPAHGAVTNSVHARVDQLLLHHQERLDASMAALQAGADTAFEVAERIHWTRRQRALADLDPFNQMLAILETAAHLEVLTELGFVRSVQAEGLVHYQV